MAIMLETTPAIEGLFSGWDETIIWSCLQRVMGRVYANNMKDPTAAAALLGDFGFLAGQADTEFLLTLKRTVCKRDFLILVPQNESWGKVIEACYGGNCRRVTRYAFKKEAESFDPLKLEGLVNSLSKEYQLTMKRTCGSLRGQADPGMPQERSVPQLGRAWSMERRAGRKAGLLLFPRVRGV